MLIIVLHLQCGVSLHLCIFHMCLSNVFISLCVVCTYRSHQVFFFKIIVIFLLIYFLFYLYWYIGTILICCIFFIYIVICRTLNSSNSFMSELF